MPFSQEARVAMLRFALTKCAVYLGTAEAVIPEWGRMPVDFEVDSEGARNTNEIVFERSAFTDDTRATHWHVYDGVGPLASDRLERPILLRTGERATFPAGALRLELR